jgi:large subunit ribosomal protein L10
MLKAEKERIVEELTERLKSTPTLFVADYRGLSVTEIDELRTKVLAHGARFTVVKNTLTKRAAEAAGTDALLALLDGPTAIAFLESDGDPVAVAKALVDAARDTRVLEVRGGLLEGRPVEASDIESLAKLPPFDVLRSQVLGAITAPLTAIVGLFTAPLQDLYGLIDARIEQLQAQGDTSGQVSGSEPQAEESGSEPQAEESGSEPQAEESGSEPQAEESGSEPQAETETETTEEEQ